MKTKKKMMAMLEIAIVLCSVFLVALPAIAADQTPQKASTSITTTASEDDYVLGIYGNANEDDTIDMGDVVYTKLAIFGKKPKTELCDAKYDGRINVLDVIQTKLIILGKEKELTIEDGADRIVTVKKPVKRIIAATTYVIEPLRTLNAADKIVGVDNYLKKAPKIYFGELCELPCIGSTSNPDYEVLLSLEPDLVIISIASGKDAVVDKIESADPNLPILRFGFWGMAQSGGMDAGIKDMRKLGYIVDSKDEAEEYIDWCYSGIIDSIKARTEKLSDDEKPRVLYGNFKKGGAAWFTHGKNSALNDRLEIAGGKNIAGDIEYFVDFGILYGYVGLEWVIEQNPEIIVRYYTGSVQSLTYWWSYGIDDMAGIIAQREEVLNNPILAEVSAVKNKKVQIISVDIRGGFGSDAIGIAYYAKWFHPELFKDLDPKAIHQEFLTRFQRIDYDLDEHGVFVYPPLED